MYLVVANPLIVDILGNVVPVDPHFGTEVPPAARPGLRLVNSIWVKRVMTDDPVKALYKRNDSGMNFYYVQDNPLPHSLPDEKVLYVYINKAAGPSRQAIFIDKFSQ